MADCLAVPVSPIVSNQLGRTLTIESVFIDEQLRTYQEVEAGSQVTLRVMGGVVDSETDCGSCITQLYARLNGQWSLCLGTSTSSFSVDASITFTAPSEPGIYYVNPSATWQYQCVDGTDASTAFSPSTIATIRVVAP